MSKARPHVKGPIAQCVRVSFAEAYELLYDEVRSYEQDPIYSTCILQFIVDFTMGSQPWVESRNFEQANENLQAVGMEPDIAAKLIRCVSSSVELILARYWPQFFVDKDYRLKGNFDYDYIGMHDIMVRFHDAMNSGAMP